MLRYLLLMTLVFASGCADGPRVSGRAKVLKYNNYGIPVFSYRNMQIVGDMPIAKLDSAIHFLDTNGPHGPVLSVIYPVREGGGLKVGDVRIMTSHPGETSSGWMYDIRPSKGAGWVVVDSAHWAY